MAKRDLSSADVEKAKEAISLLASIVTPSATPSTLQESGEKKGDKEDQGLMKAADKALHALKGMRRGLSGDGKRSRLKDELLNSFSSKKKKTAWKHRFVCLAYYEQPKIPTTDSDKDELIKAGLGEKSIEFPSLAISGEELNDIFYSAFPKLKEGGGFELCRCIANSRKLEPLSTIAHSSPSHLKERVGNSRTYIRPLQKDLDLSEVIGLPTGPKMECLTCGLKLTREEIKIHARECEKELDDLHLPSRSPSPISPPSSPDLPRIALRSSTCKIPSEDVLYVGTSMRIEGGDSIENEFIDAALQQSIDDLNCGASSEVLSPERNDTSLASEVRMLQRQIDGNGILSLDIRRDFIIDDVMREAKKKKFDPYKSVKVTFTSEGAIDNGGPRREFFRLVALKSSETYFVGEKGAKYFCNNVSALQKNEFFYLGQYTAMSIAQGGNGFPFLAAPVYTYISMGLYTNLEVNVETISDCFLKFAVKKITEAVNNVELQATLAIDEVSDLLLQSGFRKSIVSLTILDKKEILGALVDYHMMVKVKSSMDQYIEGLQVYDLISKIRASPEVWKPVFVASSQQLDPDTFKSYFKVMYAAKGSNLCPQQEQAYIHFVDFLDECYDGDTICSVEDVLAFCSASSHMPPLGFEKSPTITFQHKGVCATASTCDIQLRLPVNHSEYSSFKDALILSVKGNDGFGGV